MLTAIGLIGAGFVLGVVLMAILAGYVFGHMQAEMARALEDYGGMTFRICTPAPYPGGDRS
jgi:UPF0716 family protein affecting phage T7 exclusion